MAEKRPWEDVTDPSYFRAVMRNFVAMGFGPSKGSEAVVRFGSTGGGVHPNYQIEGRDASVQCFRGSNHKEADDLAEAFIPANISEPFTYDEVSELLKARL